MSRAIDVGEGTGVLLPTTTHMSRRLSWSIGRGQDTSFLVLLYLWGFGGGPGVNRGFT